MSDYSLSAIPGTTGLIRSRTSFEMYATCNIDYLGAKPLDSIRSHHWLTAIILKLFNKITEIKTKSNQIIYLNTNSLNKWLDKYQKLDYKKCNYAQRIDGICRNVFKKGKAKECLSHRMTFGFGNYLG